MGALGPGKGDLELPPAAGGAAAEGSEWCVLSPLEAGIILAIWCHQQLQRLLQREATEAEQFVVAQAT